MIIRVIKKFFLHAFIIATFFICYSANCFFKEENDNKKFIQTKTEKALSGIKKQNKKL